MEIFAKLFRQSKGEPITYQGRTLYLAETLRVRNGERFLVILEKVDSIWKQGVSLALSKGRLCVAGREFSKGIVLWEDTAPVSTEVSVVLKRGRTESLYVKNVWDKGDGLMDSWRHGAAIMIEELPDGSRRYHCNDGHLDDDFNTAGAIGVLFDLARKTRNLTSLKTAWLVTDEQFLWVTGTIISLGRLLGLFLHKPAWQKGLDELQEKLSQLLVNLSDSNRTANELEATDAKRSLELLIEMRDFARDKSDYKTADTIRDRLNELGITLEDVQGKTIWHM